LNEIVAAAAVDSKARLEALEGIAGQLLERARRAGPRAAGPRQTSSTPWRSPAPARSRGGFG